MPGRLALFILLLPLASPYTNELQRWRSQRWRKTKSHHQQRALLPAEPSFDLAIGLADNVSALALHVFVTSFQYHASPQARLVLLAFSEQTMPNVSSFNQTGRAAVSTAWLPKNDSQYLSNQRFSAYLQYVDALVERPRYVLNSDVTDCLFQKDPFVLVADGGGSLVTAAERRDVSISQQGDNAGWMQNEVDCHQSSLQEADYADLVVLCSGFTIGPLDRMMSYWRAMATELGSCHPTVMGQDQGAHQYLLRHSTWLAQQQLAAAASAATAVTRHAEVPAPAFVRVESLETGRIATIGDLSDDYAGGWGLHECNGTAGVICFDSSGTLLNELGQVYPVVHQYNRHRGLIERAWQRSLCYHAQNAHEGMARYSCDPPWPVRLRALSLE